MNKNRMLLYIAGLIAILGSFESRVCGINTFKSALDKSVKVKTVKYLLAVRCNKESGATKHV